MLTSWQELSNGRTGFSRQRLCRCRKSGRQRYCGKEGCLDACCSARLLSHRANGNLAAFFDGLREGSKEKHTVWQEYLEYLGICGSDMHYYETGAIGDYMAV